MWNERGEYYVHYVPIQPAPAAGQHERPQAEDVLELALRAVVRLVLFGELLHLLVGGGAAELGAQIDADKAHRRGDEEGDPHPQGAEDLGGRGGRDDGGDKAPGDKPGQGPAPEQAAEE